MIKVKKIEEEIKQSKPFNNEYHKAGVNLIYTGKWIINLHNEIFHLHNISLQQYNTLRILRGCFPKSVTIKYIKKRMLDKMSDVSRIIETMNKKGIVIREQSTGDRRKVNVKITSKGLDILSEIDKKHHIMDGYLSNLDQEEIAQLNVLLDKVRG